MTKTLNETAMRSELQGSAFFSTNAPDKPADAGIETQPRDEPKNPAKHDPVTPRHHGPTTPSPDSEEQIVERIRRAVRQLGKEDATYRFTDAEKKALADVVYTYGSAGIRTSQNEVTRIAINWLMEDYRVNGANSVLARVLERLNA